MDNNKSRIRQLLDGLDSKPTKAKAQEKPSVVVEQAVAKSGAVETAPLGQAPSHVQQVGGRRWNLVWIGAAVMVVGLIGIVAFGSTRNMLVGFVSIMAAMAGGFAIYYGLKKREEGIYIVTPDSEIKKGPMNSLNIYRDLIAFEQMGDEILLGQPRKCRNDNKYYFVHIHGSAWGGEDERLIQFMLPDTQYRDPREFANNINIPAHRRLAQRRPTLLEKITPWALVAAIGIVCLLFVVL